MVQCACYAASDADKAKAISIHNEGVALSEAGDFKGAAEKFALAVQLDPDNAPIEGNYGYALMKLGKLDEAIIHLERSTKLNDGYPLAWANLGTTLAGKGDTQGAIKALEKYIALSPPSEEIARVKAQVELLKTESTTTSGSATSNDYVSSITARNKLRWPKSRMPVTVFLKPGDGVAGFKPKYGELLKKAFSDWVSASKGSLTLEFVPSKDNASITTEWTTDTTGILNLSEGGDTKFRGDGEGLISTHIRLLTIDPKPQKLTPNIIRWITLHEVGHALGLLGHSTNPADIMFHSCPPQDGFVDLTARDTATIEKFYTSDLGASWLTLNDEGIKAVDREDFATAIKCYEQAIQLSPKSDAPRKNLVRAHYNWAITLLKKGDMKAPEEHFKKALEIEEKNPDESISVLISSYSKYLGLLGRTKEAADLTKRFGNRGHL